MKNTDVTKLIRIASNNIVAKPFTELCNRTFESYAKGHGYRKMANALNHKGYVTKKGNPFSTSAIAYILSNPFYIGKIEFAKVRIGMKNDVKALMIIL